MFEQHERDTRNATKAGSNSKSSEKGVEMIGDCGIQ
jgi:hypothetical protein